MLCSDKRFSLALARDLGKVMSKHEMLHQRAHLYSTEPFHPSQEQLNFKTCCIVDWHSCIVTCNYYLCLLKIKFTKVQVRLWYIKYNFIRENISPTNFQCRRKEKKMYSNEVHLWLHCAHTYSSMIYTYTNIWSSDTSFQKGEYVY